VVLLHHQHLQQLPPASHERGELLDGCVRQDRGLELGGFAEAGQQVGVQLIGLGQQPQRFGKLPHSTWIDQGHRDPAGRQLAHQGPFQSASGLDHHQGRLQRHQAFERGGNAFCVIARLPILACGPHADVQPFLRHIDTDKGMRIHLDSASILVTMKMPVLAEFGLQDHTTVRALFTTHTAAPLYFGLSRPRIMRPAVSLLIY
jgi:hypothetical protein